MKRKIPAKKQESLFSRVRKLSPAQRKAFTRKAQKMERVFVALKEAFSVRDPVARLLRTGISARVIKGARFTAGNLLDLGYGKGDLAQLGFSSEEIMAAKRAKAKR